MDGKGAGTGMAFHYQRPGVQFSLKEHTPTTLRQGAGILVDVLFVRPEADGGE